MPVKLVTKCQVGDLSDCPYSKLDSTGINCQFESFMGGGEYDCLNKKIIEETIVNWIKKHPKKVKKILDSLEVNRER